jgi:hypothetical protein
VKIPYFDYDEELDRSALADLRVPMIWDINSSCCLVMSMEQLNAELISSR